MYFPEDDENWTGISTETIVGFGTDAIGSNIDADIEISDVNKCNLRKVGVQILYLV
jgi:hypothetical protein